MEKSVSSSSDTSLVEEWETASSGSGSQSPSVGQRAEVQKVVPPSDEMDKASGGHHEGNVQSDNMGGHQGTKTKLPGDDTLKRRMGSSRFRLFQRQISTNLDDNSDSGDEANVMDEENVFQDTKPQEPLVTMPIVTMKETPFVYEKNVATPTASDLLSSSLGEIDFEIDKRLSKLTGLLEDLSDMTGHKVKIDRDKVMAEVVSNVDPSFNIER